MENKINQLDGEIGVVLGIPVEVHERYEGEYVINPKKEQQTIPCKELIMSDDFLIEAVENQEKTVKSTEQVQIVEVDDDYDGISRVIVEPVVLEEKSVKSSKQQQEITPDEGYDGISEITVEPINNQTKTAKSSEITQEVVPDDGYDGLDKVVIERIIPQRKTIFPSHEEQNITPDEGYDYLEEVVVEGISNQTKTAKSTEQVQEITADPQFDGLEKVIVQPILPQSKTIHPTSTSQTVQADNAYDYLSSVVVEGINNQSKTVKSTDETQTIEPDAGYDGISEITVEPILSQKKVITPTSEEQEIVPDEGYDYLDEVIVEASAGTDEMFKAIIGRGYCETFDIDEDITFIKSYAFQYVRTHEINAPAVTTIEDYTCNSMGMTKSSGTLQDTPIVFNAPNLQNVGQYAFAYSALGTLEALENALICGRNAFSDCKYLTQQKFGLPYFQVSIFAYCTSLTDIILTNPSISTIYNYAFEGCENLEKVRILGTVQAINSTPFSGCTKLKDIYVPWAEGAVSGAPWGARTATIHYNTTYDSEGNPV